ncbi:MAG: YkgJ family cysteine cluster protein [Candidatus Helarchaeota archaeon]
MESPSQFQCQKCGNCCNRKFLCLYPFELKKAQKYAQKLKVNIPTEPLQKLFDIKNHKIIILIYRVTIRPCPFTINNQCAIHDNKFIACRKYPISEWVDLGNFFLKLGLSNEFYNVDESCTFIKTNSEFKESLKNCSLEKILPKEYQATQRDKRIWINLITRINKLRKTQKIGIVSEAKFKKSDLEMYDKALHSWKSVSVLEYLKNLEN